MKLLVINPVSPRRTHAANAAPVVIFELVTALATFVSGRVGFLKLARPGDAPPDEADALGLTDLAAAGVELLPPFVLPRLPVKRRAWQTLVAPRTTDFYPEVVAARCLADHIAPFQPDVVFVPWSEWATAMCAELPALRFAYYGNPDPKSWRIQTELARRAGGALRHYLAGQALAARLEPIHMAIMNKYAALGNVAANDAAFYSDRGHRNAFYLQNVWIDRLGESWRAQRPTSISSGPSIIIGNVGKVWATANTLGLEVLGRDLLPILRRLLAGKDFQLHLLGSGKPHPLVANHLQGPEVIWRGFVDDIDAEILRAPIFLCMNNASAFKVGHTRYLHAWSLGACVVGHVDAALSMPEMRAGENCLLGRDIGEVATLICEALGNPALRARIGEAGYATFRQYFTAPPVAARILEHISTAPK